MVGSPLGLVEGCDVLSDETRCQMRGHQFLVTMLGAALISPQLLRSEVIILGGPVTVKHGRAWGPEQALGPPDTPGAGDMQTAWASRTPDGQDEWLELEFEEEVLPSEVVVHETYNPGSLARVTAYTKSGMAAEIWEGKDPTPATAPRGISRVKVDPGFKIKRIRIHLKSKEVTGWNEIDAVGLKDKDGKTHWAIAAKASSTYAGEPATGVLPKAMRNAAKAEARPVIGIPAIRIKPPALPRAIADKLKARDADAERRDRQEALLAEVAKMRERLAAGEAENARLKAQHALLQAELKRAQALLKEYRDALEQLRKERAEAPR